MKKTRKGFTLVELLIVVAILATLTATMTMAISGSTAKAKASAITSNVEAMKSAARLYEVNNQADNISEVTTDAMLFTCLPTWKDFSNGTVKYTAVSDTKGPNGWAVKVDFSTDPERDAIVDILQTVNGYNKSYTGADDTTGTAILTKGDPGHYSFEVTLVSGKIVAGS